MSRRVGRELMQDHVRTLMRDQVITVGPDDPLVQVTAKIAAHAIGAVPVIDAEHRLVGVLSTTDLVNLLHDGGQLDGRVARDVMSTEPISIDEFATADEAIGLMRNALIRHLPVTREGRLVGLVTASDLIRHLVTKQPPPEVA